MTKENVTKLDLEAVLKNKNPKLLKWLPKFIISYLKKTIHQDELNSGMEEYKDYKDFDFIHAILDKHIKINLVVEGLENVPKSGSVIIASNHPLGGIDGMAILKAISAKRTDVKFIVNDILGHIDNVKNLFLEVNKHGQSSKTSLDMIDKHYATSNATVIFPAGLCSRKVDGKIIDLQWKKSFITKAKKYKIPIVPTFVEAANSKFFYNLGYYRKKIGIKANVEMLYLVDEMYKQRNKTIKITFGKPIDYIKYAQIDDLKATEKMKEHVYNLAKNPNLEF